MPASLFSDMERNGRDMQEDSRALVLALEMSMQGFNGLGNENESFGSSFDSDSRNKRSQNTTECVPVPSSEHVAEIVGRQGCKIKALRSKTNTYIKTPVRGEEPVFVVTGRREDVNAAKREILSAAEHFSQIRAQRKNNLNGSLVPGPNSVVPGQMTIQVRVPYRVVGLVVGPKGATIKRIQQSTNTYIVTPSRDKQPVFEVTGLPDNVENARKEIESHIAARTGSLAEPDDSDLDSSLFTNNLNAVNCGLFKTDMGSQLIHPFSHDSNNVLDLNDGIFNLSVSGVGSKHTDLYSTMYANSITNALSLYNRDEGLGDSPIYDSTGMLVTSTWPELGSSALTNPPTLFNTAPVKNVGTTCSPKINTLDSAFHNLFLNSHSSCTETDTSVMPFGKDGLNRSDCGNILSFPSLLNGFNDSSTSDLTNNCTTISESVSDHVINLAEALTGERKPMRDCMVCHESKVDAALVPCGHNFFCLVCANHICVKSECPVCHQPASQAIRIYS